MYMYVYTYLNASLCTYVHIHILSKYTHVHHVITFVILYKASQEDVSIVSSHVLDARKPKTAGCKEMDVEGNTMEEYTTYLTENIMHTRS